MTYDDEMKQIKEIHDTLITMLDFKLFLTQHGTQVLKMIQKECIDYHEKYAQKIGEILYYRTLFRYNIWKIDSEKFASKRTLKNLMLV